MSYRSRLYNHRQVQPQEGDKKKKPFFSSRHGGGAPEDKKKFFHAAPGGAGMPQVQRLATSEIDEGLGTNEERMAREKGDKLRQDDAANGGGRMPVTPLAEKGRIQRDLAIPPDTGVAEPVLTPKQVHDAIVFNSIRYTEPSVKMIQDIVGGPVDGAMSEKTVRLIALYQAQNKLKPDGMAGPDTFRKLTGELAAEKVSRDTCLNYFLVNVTPPQLRTVRPGRVSIRGGFSVEVRFDPHCDCSRFEYRQFVSGDLTRNGVNKNTWIDHPPGGRLPGLGNWIEDGDRTLPANGPYGHRKLQPNLGGARDQYVDADGTTLNMKNGCIYQGNDLAGLAEGTGVTGDHFVLELRFMGQIIKEGKRVETKYWALRGNFTVP